MLLLLLSKTVLSFVIEQEKFTQGNHFRRGTDLDRLTGALVSPATTKGGFLAHYKWRRQNQGGAKERGEGNTRGEAEMRRKPLYTLCSHLGIRSVFVVARGTPLFHRGPAEKERAKGEMEEGEKRKKAQKG